MLAFGSSCKGSGSGCKDPAIKRGAPPHCARSYADKEPAFIPSPPAPASGTQALDFRRKGGFGGSYVCHMGIFLEMRTWIDKGSV